MQDFELDPYLARNRKLIENALHELVPPEAGRSSSLYARMLDYPLREAKGLRPSLTIATCRALGGKLQAVLPTAAVLELYHNAFLIHDDIEDQSERRRGQPTLHRMYGMPVAVNVGDAMFAMCLRPLLDNMRTLGMGPALRILQEIAEMARISAEGQAIELEWTRTGEWDLHDDDYVDMVSKKTARYTFVTPMVCGAIIAECRDLDRELLESFALDVGIAFQIQDDILNITADEQRYGKEIGGDLWEGKHTLMLLHAIRHASAAERQRAKTILAKPRPRSERTAAAARELVGLADRLLATDQLSTSARASIEEFLTSTGVGVDAKMPEDVDFLLRLIEKTGGVEHAKRIALMYHERSQQTLKHLLPWFARNEAGEAAEDTRALLAMAHYAVKRIW